MRHLCSKCGEVELIVLEGPDTKGRSLYACPTCKTPFGWQSPERASVPQFGPGTELHKLIHQIGFNIGGCSCQQWLDKMNAWGVDGCREHRAEIVSHLEQEKDAASLASKLKAGALALKNGLPMTIGGLVDEAIQRAAARDAE